MSFNLGSTKIGTMYLGSTKIAKAYLGSTLVYSSDTPTPTGYETFRISIDIGSSADNITCSGFYFDDVNATADQGVSGIIETPWSSSAMTEDQVTAIMTGDSTLYCTKLTLTVKPGKTISTITWKPKSWQTSHDATVKCYGITSDGTETLLVNKEVTLVGGTNIVLEVA